MVGNLIRHDSNDGTRARQTPDGQHDALLAEFVRIRIRGRSVSYIRISSFQSPLNLFLRKWIRGLALHSRMSQNIWHVGVRVEVHVQILVATLPPANQNSLVSVRAPYV